MSESINTEINDLKTVVKVDRVVLDLKSVEVLNILLQQVQKEIGHIVDLNQKDLVNFIIQQRSQRFSEEELSHLKSTSFDLVKTLKRVTQNAIKAKQGGTPIDLTEVLKIIQTQSVNEFSVPKVARGRKKKPDQSPSPTESSGINTMASAASDNDLIVQRPIKTASQKDSDLIINTELINS